MPDGRCKQELCPNWSGDGRVCPCAIFDLDTPDADSGESEMPPLPTNLDDWHATVHLYRDPSWLRAKADDIERRRRPRDRS